MEQQNNALSQDEVKKRNKRLEEFFKNAMPNRVIRIIGDENSPAVVIDFEYILSCYVNGFKLHFQKENKGEDVFTISLAKEVLEYNESQFFSWYEDSTHRKIYRIRLRCPHVSQPDLFLSGWNFRNKIDKEGKYPVFSEYEPKVYFKLETAEDIDVELCLSGYDIEII